MRLDHLAQQIHGRLIGDGSLEIGAVRHLEEAGVHDVALALHPKELRRAAACAAGALIVSIDFAAEHAHELPCAAIACESPAQGLRLAIAALHPMQAAVPTGVHPAATVAAGARLGAASSVGPHAVVGAAILGARVQLGAHVVVEDGVTIGDDTLVGAGARLLAGVRVGHRVRVGPNSVIGDVGFVFAPAGTINEAVHHLAAVDIGDDVEIGACVCIDRGALRDTRVGRGTKIDNLVQVGHDVQIGRDVVIVAQVGIAGDAVIGDGAVIAGQAGIKEHVHIGAGARVGGQAGVTADVRAHTAVLGMPARPHLAALRAMARADQLDSLYKRVRSLERGRADDR